MSNSTPAPTNPTNETTEEWRPVPGHEGYEVSSLGRVRSIDRTVHGGRGGTRRVRGRVRKLVVTPATDRHGIAVWNQERSTTQTYTVSTWVAAAFLGPRPEGHDVHHINGDRRDDRAENLMYLPHKFHQQVSSRGESNGNAKLSRVQVQEIRELLASKSLSQQEIAKLFGVSKSMISEIKRDKNWIYAS